MYEGNGSKEINAPGSTIGVQTYQITKLNTINKTDIVIWDFAGQLEYTTNHQVHFSRILT